MMPQFMGDNIFYQCRIVGFRIADKVNMGFVIFKSYRSIPNQTPLRRNVVRNRRACAQPFGPGMSIGPCTQWMIVRQRRDLRLLPHHNTGWHFRHHATTAMAQQTHHSIDAVIECHSSLQGQSRHCKGGQTTP